MSISEREAERAARRMGALRQGGHAVAARYDRRTRRIVVGLASGVEIAFPAAMAEGLSDASAADLAAIEITPAGLGLHWPRLDADLYVPGLLQGVFGSQASAARALGATGGRVRSRAKAAAARANGRKGGRPRKTSG